MNPTAIKSKTPYVTSHKLARTPASEESKQRAKYIREHNFSVKIDKSTGEIICKTTKKE